MCFHQRCNTLASSCSQDGNMLVFFFVLCVSSLSFSFSGIVSYSFSVPICVLFFVVVYWTHLYCV